MCQEGSHWSPCPSTAHPKRTVWNSLCGSGIAEGGKTLLLSTATLCQGSSAEGRNTARVQTSEDRRSGLALGGPPWDSLGRGVRGKAEEVGSRGPFRASKMLASPPWRVAQRVVGDFPGKIGSVRPVPGGGDLCRPIREFSIPQNPARFQVQESRGPHAARADARVCRVEVGEELTHSSLSLVGGFCLLVYKCKSKVAWKTDNMETAKLN